MIKLGHYLAAGACLTLLAAPAHAEDGPVLKIENFIGTVNVVTGDYGSISVTKADGAPVEKSGDNVSIDGDETTRNINCRQNKTSIKIGKGKWGWGNKDRGYKDLSEYPSVTITAPENTHLIIENSLVFGEVDTIGSGDIHVRSCGDLGLADINGSLDLGISGSGDVRMGSAGDADISISGSGDLTARDFTALELSVSGSGDAELGNVAGFAHIHSSGSGDVEMGRIGGGLDYSGSGSSDFGAEYVSGDLSVSSSGSGDIDINDGVVQKLYVSASGASDVRYDGSSVDAEARASGGSNIHIHRPSGQLRSHDSGGGDVNIDG
jgi:hypothetical protein